ncbi:MAG: WD40 repeat domain-containing protein [Planctomycetota bacterium]|jgi:WD40 repeat protein
MKILILTPALLLALFAGNGLAQGNPEVIWMVDGHTRSVEAVAYSPDGQTVASGADYDDSQVKLWRVCNGALLDTFIDHSTGVRSIDFSPDGQLMAVGYIVSGYPPGGQMKLWDVQAQTTRNTFGGCFVSFSSDGAFVASGGGGVNRYLQVHRVDNGEKIAQFYTGSYITSVDYSPTANIVATGQTDNTIKIWDVDQGQLARTLSGHLDDVQTVAFSPDGQLLASGAGGWDNPGESTIKIWRVSDWSLLDTFIGHGDWVHKVAFSPDGEVLLSSGRDGVYPNASSQIKFWRVSDGALLKYYDELALDLTFSHDGRQFCYGRGDGVLVVANNPVDDFETYLFYTGNAFAGNTVDIQLIGPPGASPVGLWVGSDVLNPPLPSSWGSWYLQFPVFGPVVFPPIPAGGVQVFRVTIPATPPGPYDLPLQALIGDELSNLCILALE